MSASSGDMTSILGNLVGQGAVTANGIIGNNNATSAVTTGLQNGINTQANVQSQNANALGTTANTNAGVLAPGAATGAAADSNLATYLGLNGQPADFSQFYNTPGYQFAVSQGTNAINSQAAASGSAFTPNTLAAVGNYVQGAASTNYNNYINQLLGVSGQGITAQQGIVNSNTGLTEAGAQSNLSTGANISTMQGAQGAANATGVANQTNDIGTALGALGGASGISGLVTNLLGGSSTGGANASGLGSTLGSLGTLVNGALGGTGTGGNLSATQYSNLIGGNVPLTNNQASDTDLNATNAQLAAQYSGTGAATTPTVTTGDDDLDWLDGGPSGAGGQATGSTPANGVQSVDTGSMLTGLSTPGSVNTSLPGSAASIGSDIGSVGGIISGLGSGSPVGLASAGLNATKLASSNNLLGANSSTIGSGVGSGLSALGIYQGIEQGGVAGDTTAAINAAQLAVKGAAAVGAISGGAASAAGSFLGAAAIPLDLYNEVKSYQSGATGSDALSGAETGAAIGSMIVPGIGTAIGAVVGAVGGAVASAFGGGRPDQETTTGQSIDAALASGQATVSSTGLNTDSGAFQYLAGLMDAKNNTAGHSTAMEQVFGREGEGSVLNGMASTIDTAVSGGNMTILPSGAVSFKTGGGTVVYPASQASAGVYSQVIAPWLQSKGASVDSAGVDVKGNNIGQATVASLQTLISSYISGSLNSSTVIGAQGQADSTLPSFV